MSAAVAAAALALPLPRLVAAAADFSVAWTCGATSCSSAAAVSLLSAVAVLSVFVLPSASVTIRSQTGKDTA